MFLTGYSNPRGIISWVLGLGANARLLGPEELARGVRPPPGAAGGAPPRGGAELGRLGARAPSDGHGAAGGRTPRELARPNARAETAEGENGRAEAAIRPERFARLVTLASILIRAGRAGERVSDRGASASACS